MTLIVNDNLIPLYAPLSITTVDANSCIGEVNTQDLESLCGGDWGKFYTLNFGQKSDGEIDKSFIQEVFEGMASLYSKFSYTKRQLPTKPLKAFKALKSSSIDDNIRWAYDYITQLYDMLGEVRMATISEQIKENTLKMAEENGYSVFEKIGEDGSSELVIRIPKEEFMSKSGLNTRCDMHTVNMVDELVEAATKRIEEQNIKQNWESICNDAQSMEGFDKVTKAMAEVSRRNIQSELFNSPDAIEKIITLHGGRVSKKSAEKIFQILKRTSNKYRSIGEFERAVIDVYENHLDDTLKARNLNCLKKCLPPSSNVDFNGFSLEHMRDWVLKHLDFENIPSDYLTRLGLEYIKTHSPTDKVVFDKTPLRFSDIVSNEGLLAERKVSKESIDIESLLKHCFRQHGVYVTSDSLYKIVQLCENLSENMMADPVRIGKELYTKLTNEDIPHEIARDIVTKLKVKWVLR